MKKLILILCIAMAGQVYGQLTLRDGDEILNNRQVEKELLEELLKTENHLFKDSWEVISECKANLEDAMAHHSKEGKWNDVSWISLLLIQMEKLNGGYLMINNMSRVMVINFDDKEQRKWVYEIILAAMRYFEYDAKYALGIIKDSEHRYEGSYAMNLLNLKKELRTVIKKCEDILEAA